MMNTDIENEIIPELDESAVADEIKIVKKTRFKLTEVTISTVIVMVLIAFNQGKKLFLFDFLSTASPSADTIISVFSGRVFGMIIYGTLLFILAFSVYLSGRLKKRLKLTMEERCGSYAGFKRHYDVYDLLGVVPVFLAVVVIVNAFFLSPAIVHGPSMQPTFYENDGVLVYHFTIDPQREDIIIYDRGDALLVKRIAGIPGDHLVVDLTGVYINGEKLNVIGDEINYEFYDGIIPENSYFILGDNSGDSNDSRAFGLISGDDILGKVIFKIGSSSIF